MNNVLPELSIANYLGNAAWVKRIEQLYDSYDLNKNGYLTKEEFHQH